MEPFDSLTLEHLKLEKDAAIRVKDDLAAQLRVMKKRLQEAEEEQYKAEEDAAALRAELEALNRREEHRNVVASTATIPQYHFLEQEVATLKIELQAAIQKLQQEQQKVTVEQEHVASLVGEQEQLKKALAEAQKAQEATTNSAGRFSTEGKIKGKTNQDYQLQELASMVERLESGRQKLLAEIDAQSLEIERLFIENDGLSACLKEASVFSGQWEQKVQECLQENAMLRAELDDVRTRLAHKLNGDVSPADKDMESSRLQAELLKAKGQAEALSAQVLQLSADLNCAMQHIGSLNWLYKPVLANIENRLLLLKQHGSNGGVTA